MLEAEQAAFGKESMVQDAAGEWKHWWFGSDLVCHAAQLARAQAVAAGLPPWRTKKLDRSPPPDGELRPGTPRLFACGMDLRPGDFINPELRCYAIQEWEYQPGCGTRVPPPTEADPTSWRGAPTWQDSQNFWYELYDDGRRDGMPGAGPERRSAWQNALKRYARDVLAWKKEFE